MTSNNSFPAHRARVGAAIAIVLINAVLLTVLLVAMELLLRAFAVPSAVEYSVYAPNLRTTVTVDASITPGVRDSAIFEINALGTRGPLPKSDDDVRILTIGGSTTECFVLSLEESWPFLLGKALEANTGAKIWVGNIARAGRTSRQNYLDAKYVVAQFGRVDFVTLLVGINDLFYRMIQGSSFSAQDVAAPDTDGRLIGASLYVSQHPGDWFESLQLVGGVRRALENLALLSAREREVRRSLNQTLPDFYVSSRRKRARRGETIDRLPPMEAPIAEFERNISLIVKSLRDNGTVPILVTQPALWRPDLEEQKQRLLWLGSAEGWPPRRTGGPYYSVAAMAEMLDLYNGALRRLAVADRIELVDLAEMLDGDLDVFYDDIHFNEYGARRAAEAISGYFATRDLVGRRRAGQLR